MGLSDMFFGGNNSPGIFGAIHALFMHGGMLKDKVDNQIYDTNEKNKAKQKQQFTYKNRQGREFLTSNNREVFVSSFGGFNDRPVYKDLKTGKPICYVEDVLIEKQRYVNKIKAIQNGESAFLYLEKDRYPAEIEHYANLETDDGWFGNIYEDIETGEHYVIRTINNYLMHKRQRIASKKVFHELGISLPTIPYQVHYFVNILNGHIVRLTDVPFYQNDEFAYEYSFDIDKFNRTQDMIINKFGVYMLQRDHVADPWGFYPSCWHDSKKKEEYRKFWGLFEKEVWNIDYNDFDEINITEDDLDEFLQKYREANL